MRLTRANVEELETLMEDVEQAQNDAIDVWQMWADEDTDREERAEAREQLTDDLLPALEDALERALDQLRGKDHKR